MFNRFFNDFEVGGVKKKEERINMKIHIRFCCKFCGPALGELGELGNVTTSPSLGGGWKRESSKWRLIFDVLNICFIIL